MDANDGALITKVKEALERDSEIKSSDSIFVSTSEKTITLKGVVESEQERNRAVEIARGVHGVLSVSDEMKVMPESAEDAPDQAQGGPGRPRQSGMKDEHGQQQGMRKPEPVN